MKKVLTVAGSDCSGGAGIQADLKTMTVHRVYGMSVITALTAQNTMGVNEVFPVSAQFVGAQLDAVFTDIFPDAIKVGMVADDEIIEVIRQKFNEYGARNIVIDPVMVSTSGNRLLDTSAVDAVIDSLIPTASVITPNIPEAEVLSGCKIIEPKDMVAAAEKISIGFEGAVLITGGHLANSADDLLFAEGNVMWFKGERINNENTHGTGCTLSSAIACNLALGLDLKESVSRAKDYVKGAIKSGLDLGKGSGPLNHAY
ncbi:MAG: bifunctional hydroxymethylpyrimidine kinase/phosphomethylpyrimidine kinase [Bacillota bacterium]|nr:bifunctional hydroxymethylpyrimidine kinase/phosphomethylpyrimidine kinase [Bacillota bacterium]